MPHSINRMVESVRHIIVQEENIITEPEKLKLDCACALLVAMMPREDEKKACVRLTDDGMVGIAVLIVNDIWNEQVNSLN